MLRRLTLGLAGLSFAVAIAACTSNMTPNNCPTTTNCTGVGPNFPTSTLYAVDQTKNGVAIYLQDSKSGSSPNYEIGGGSTTIDGPQYISFDVSKNLWMTNFDSGTGIGQLLVFKYLATGNVIPFQTITYSLLGQPRGIALNTATGDVAVAAVFPQAQSPALPSQIQIYTTLDNGASVPYAVISGALTRLNVPSGLAYCSIAACNGHVFVANRQGASVESFTLPTPTPAPSPTPSHSPSPSPSPSSSPTAEPTAQVYYNIPPITNIVGSNTGLVGPAGVAFDANGNIYVSDAATASIRVFKAGANGNVKPIFVIAGSNTKLQIPLDVKVDSTGKIYVSDPGAGQILIYPAMPASPPSTPVNESPAVEFPTGAGLVGIGLSP